MYRLHFSLVDYFGMVINALKTRLALPNSSSLFSLHPILGSIGILSWWKETKFSFRLLLSTSCHTFCKGSLIILNISSEYLCWTYTPHCTHLSSLSHHWILQDHFFCYSLMHCLLMHAHKTLTSVVGPITNGVSYSWSYLQHRCRL